MRVLGACALAALASCSGCELAPESLSSSEEFVLLPRIVHVPASGITAPLALRLEVVARDAWQNPTTPALTWESTNLDVTFVSSGMATVATLPIMAPGSNLVIKVRSQTLWSATIFLFDVDPAAPSDQARNEFARGDNPSIALLTGRSSGGCAHDNVVAFVGGGTIGQWTQDAGCDREDAAIFSVNSRPLLKRPAGWTDMADLVDATGNGGPIGIPIQLVIGVAADEADAAASNEAAYLLTTGDTYRTMRAGIELPASAQTTIRQPLPGTITRCSDLAALPASVLPDPKKLNIYHLSAVNGPDGPVLGYFCTPNVILIDHALALATTLGHELGHALGLIEPLNGHTDPPVMQGFIRDNVMSTNARDGQDARFRFSLGQLYRMHYEGRSWLQRDMNLGDGPNKCSCDPYARNVCPALATDLWIPAVPLPPAGGTCP